MEWESWELRENPEKSIDWEYGKNTAMDGWKWGNGIHTHTSCDDATLNCYRYFISHTAKKYGREENQAWKPRTGRGKLNGNGNGLARKGKERIRETGLDCHRAGLQHCSCGLLGKKSEESGRQGRGGLGPFSFSFCSSARCFLVYTIVFFSTSTSSCLDSFSFLKKLCETNTC
jgi:hypothetical protein